MAGQKGLLVNIKILVENVEGTLRRTLRDVKTNVTGVTGNATDVKANVTANVTDVTAITANVAVDFTNVTGALR